MAMPSLILAVVVGICCTVDSAAAQEAAAVPDQTARPRSTKSTDATKSKRPETIDSHGMVMLDYEVVKVPTGKSIDLMGFHFLNKMNDWLYLGVGGYAPLFKGEYGGFMALDVSAHVQRRIFNNVFADAGLSAGGGGGGKSVQQSKILSGTGGFVKSYVGLGYGAEDLTFGANLSRMKFSRSTIDHSQLDIFVQVPFYYATGPYASANDRFLVGGKPDVDGPLDGSSENTLTLGLDNFMQIDPKGSNKQTINVADLQYSHFITKDGYWYVNAGVGYHGLPLYNQVLGGLGYRIPASSRLNLYGQLGLGSGGYAPETIDTGPGLLVYPKVSAEYLFDKDVGVSLWAGYMFAPKGTSKNYTVGASLNYHIHSTGTSFEAGAPASDVRYRGYRVSLFQQTEFNVKTAGMAGSDIKMATAQFDGVANRHVYIPVQVSIAYNAYLGYPGYGELLAGAGLQSRYDRGDRLQIFGQALVGTNSHGAIVKTGVGLNFGLSDRLALYGVAGQTFAIGQKKFRSDYAGLGLTYRFSAPSW